MIPSLVTQFIVLFKDTSLASIIRLHGSDQGRPGGEQPRDPPVPIYLFIAVVYWSAPTPCLATRVTWREDGPCLKSFLPTGVRLHWREAGLAAGPPGSSPIVWITGARWRTPRSWWRISSRSSAACARSSPIRAATASRRASSGWRTTPTRARPRTCLAWLDGLGVREAVWGGASMGGALSLWIAAHAPARARAVISISGPPFVPSDEDKRWWAGSGRWLEAGRFESTSTPMSACAWGRDALTRLKARPDRYAEADRRPAAALGGLAARAARRDLQPDRMAGRLPAQSAARSR